MYPTSRLRSTPVRLALLFAFLCMLAFAVAGAVVYQLVEDALAQRLDAALRETWAVVVATYGEGDLEDVVTAIQSYAALPTAESQVFSLVDGSGQRLAGNLTVQPVPDGFGSLTAGVEPDGEPRRYRTYAGAVGGMRLVVGRDYAEIEEVTELVLASLGWAALAVMLIAAGGGLWLGLRARTRLTAIAGTLAEISHGKLAARIPLVGAGDDIDALSAQVNGALERLAALVESMRQVSADIAHDLKTPLNRLRFRLERAGDLIERGEDASVAMAEAQAESAQINATFEALLRIAQLEAGARKARFAPVDLAALLDSLVEIYADVAADAGHTLRWSRGTGDAKVHGDSELMTQLFVNLIENAIRHCPPGATIELQLAAARGGLSVLVTDNGPGIPAEEHEKVFRRLYRLNKSRSTPGSGLGLSLVRAIAELHGAKVRLLAHSPGLQVQVIFLRADSMFPIFNIMS